MDAFFDAIMSPAGMLGLFVLTFIVIHCKQKYALLAPFESIAPTHHSARRVSSPPSTVN